MAALDVAEDCLQNISDILLEQSMLEMEENQLYRWPLWWFVQIVFGLIFVVGLVGNTMIIWVVLRFQKMQTVTNFYIVNLAVVYEIFLLGIPFLLTTSVLQYWPFGLLICKMYFISTGINQITSSMFLLVMVADRYLAECHPITASEWRTLRVAKMVALAAWVLSALLMVPIFIYANTLYVDLKMGNCNCPLGSINYICNLWFLQPNCLIIWPNSSSLGISGDVIFTFYSFIFGFALPLLLILPFYILVIMRLRTVGLGPKNKEVSLEIETQQALHQNSLAKERTKSHRKLTKLVLTVIAVYFISWFPYWVTQMVMVFMPDDADYKDITIIYFISGCLSYSNSAMNPILYAFMSEDFKQSFKKACPCVTSTRDYDNTIKKKTSMFPRRKGTSYRRRKHSTNTASATFTGTECPEMSMAETSLKDCVTM